MPHGKVRNLAIVTTLSVALLGAAAGTAVAATGPAQQQVVAPRAQQTPQAQQGTLTSTVDGTFTDATGRPGTVTGTFTPSSFAQQGNGVVATGTLVATMVNSAGQQVGTTTQTVAVPMRLPQVAACPVLNLVLGPLDLNLLGLAVHLNQIHLNITAIPGAGNLLGNLLCAVAGLLDGTGGLGILVADLNAILAALGL